MALPASGYLQLGTDGATGRSINSEFGYGNDMASYFGVYAGKSGLAYQFPLVGNSLAMDLFYSTSRINGGSASYGSSQTITVPVYNTITITCIGGQGGQSGGVGINCSNSFVRSGLASGNPGGTSSFGGYVSSGGGAGGSNASQQFVSGVFGPTVTQTFTNPIQGGAGPPSGDSIFVSVGGGGSGGRGADTRTFDFSGNCYYPFPGAVAPSGGSGGSGSISISWT